MPGDHLQRIVEIERRRGALRLAGERASIGSNMDLVGHSAAAVLDICRPTPPFDAEAIVSGYAELRRDVFAHFAELPFLESQIKYFHSLLLRNDPAAAGHRRMYRDVDVGPSSPAASEVASRMGGIVAAAKRGFDDPSRHPLCVTAEFLYAFLRVRPFVDGNVRLALALGSHLLLRHGYDHIGAGPLEPEIASRRDDLAAALDGESGLAAWTGVFLDSVAASQDRALGALTPVPAARVNARQERVLAILAERGTVKIGDLIERTGHPRATLKKDLRDLVGMRRVVSSGIRKGTVYRLL